MFWNEYINKKAFQFGVYHLLHIVRRVKPMNGRPWWKKQIMEECQHQGAQRVEQVFSHQGRGPLH